MNASRSTLLLLAGALFASQPIAAQQPARDGARTAIRGIVVDALRGDPLPNAMVRLEGGRKGVLTDSLGRFTISGVRIGPDVMAVKQYGYEEVRAQIDFGENTPLLRFELDPGPIALEGFDIVADRLAVMKQRLQNRRNAAAVSVRMFDQDRLNRSAARDMLDFLAMSGGIRPADCASRGPTSFVSSGRGTLGWASGSCIERRGGVMAPRIYIDEAIAIGGMDQLAMYGPHEFYTVEIYSQGAEIRAYTHNFMERMARRPMALIPLEMFFGR
jgi:hypothetical protein